MELLLAGWDRESVSVHRDEQSGATMFVCVHSTRLGRAAGGTRMKHYPTLTDALRDGMRLSEAMSYKFASVDFPHGGGKAVIALATSDPPVGEARRRLLHEDGRFVTSLGGLYSCAPDMNTSAVDMDVISEVPTSSAGPRPRADQATPRPTPRSACGTASARRADSPSDPTS